MSKKCEHHGCLGNNFGMKSNRMPRDVEYVAYYICASTRKVSDEYGVWSVNKIIGDVDGAYFQFISPKMIKYSYKFVLYFYWMNRVELMRKKSM